MVDGFHSPRPKEDSRIAGCTMDNRKRRETIAQSPEDSYGTFASGAMLLFTKSRRPAFSLTMRTARRSAFPLSVHFPFLCSLIHDSPILVPVHLAAFSPLRSTGFHRLRGTHQIFPHQTRHRVCTRGASSLGDARNRNKLHVRNGFTFIGLPARGA